MTFEMLMILMGWPYDSFDCLLFVFVNTNPNIHTRSCVRPVLVTVIYSHSDLFKKLGKNIFIFVFAKKSNSTIFEFEFSKHFNPNIFVFVLLPENHICHPLTKTHLL